MKDYKLQGRIEAVDIIERVTDSSSFGKLVKTGVGVMINNGNNYHGRTCLMRLHLKQHAKRDHLGSFISTNVPEGFAGLALDEYILCGVHNFGERISSFDEFNRFYQPGRVSRVIYLNRGFSKYCGKSLLTYKDEQSLNGITLGRSLRKKLSDPDKGARVVIMQDNYDLERVVQKIEEIRLKAVKMETLK